MSCRWSVAFNLGWQNIERSGFPAGSQTSHGDHQPRGWVPGCTTMLYVGEQDQSASDRAAGRSSVRSHTVLFAWIVMAEDRLDSLVRVRILSRFEDALQSCKPSGQSRSVRTVGIRAQMSMRTGIRAGFNPPSTVEDTLIPVAWLESIVSPSERNWTPTSTSRLGFHPVVNLLTCRSTWPCGLFEQVGDGIEGPALMPARQGRKAMPVISRSIGVNNERLIYYLPCLRFFVNPDLACNEQDA